MRKFPIKFTSAFQKLLGIIILCVGVTFQFDLGLGLAIFGGCLLLDSYFENRRG